MQTLSLRLHFEHEFVQTLVHTGRERYVARSLAPAVSFCLGEPRHIKTPQKSFLTGTRQADHDNTWGIQLIFLQVLVCEIVLQLKTDSADETCVKCKLFQANTRLSFSWKSSPKSLKSCSERDESSFSALRSDVDWEEVAIPAAFCPTGARYEPALLTRSVR